MVQAGPCHDQPVHAFGSARHEHVGALVGCGAGGVHVVYEKYAAPRYSCTAAQGEGAGDVAPARCLVQADLWRRRADALQEERCQKRAASPGQWPGQEKRLVEAPPAQTLDVQRNGGDGAVNQAKW